MSDLSGLEIAGSAAVVPDCERPGTVGRGTGASPTIANRVPSKLDAGILRSQFIASSFLNRGLTRAASATDRAAWFGVLLKSKAQPLSTGQT